MTSSSKPSLSIVSFNVCGFHWGGVPFRQRMGTLYDFLRHQSVSELHLQEVFTYGQLNELIKNIPLRHVAYQKGLNGPRGGLVSFFADHPSDVEFHPLDPSVLAWFDWLRVVPYVHKGVLIIHTNDGGIRYNLHLDPNHSGDWERPSRQVSLIARQLDEVANIIIKMVEATPPSELFVVGDFNLPHTAPTYTDFVRKVGLHDAFKGDDRPTYHKFFLPEGRIPHQIDHILYWSSKKILDGLIQPRQIFTEPIGDKDHAMYISDHVGLAIEIDGKDDSMDPVLI